MSKNILITGSSGLVGSHAVRFFSAKGFRVFGIDNDSRGVFFGKEASTKKTLKELKKNLPRFTNYEIDIRNTRKTSGIFKKNRFDAVLHAAAQPSHDWATKFPLVDFDINARSTLALLEHCRVFSPKAVFIYISTNKVYGDSVNLLPLKEKKYRFDLPKNHPLYAGINEQQSIDQTMHSLFGTSKLYADLLVQEYGSYFGMKTVTLRSGCITGADQRGSQLHGFLSYLAKCIYTGKKYTIFGYKGKQVRDNIHVYDLVTAVYEILKKYRNPVYNIGGSRECNISLLEAIDKISAVLGKKCALDYCRNPRKGDHIWYISDMSKFKNDYSAWKMEFNIDSTIKDICRALKK